MNKQEVAEKVKKIIEERLRPALQMDGGDITFEELTDDMVVNVRLHGACGTCPRAQMTLKQGVEVAIRSEIPEVVEVNAVGF
ncbi:MAG: NifU family protein [Bacteroidales bacterium]|nr:NifU family protein [bacterium]MDE5762104.1 NifU family protein [Bacteroidales bacterium]MDE6631307.1 NifU family protein [Bacteroidales bacterium]MDE7101316.1 NifU family protein [Bacteroidales bacterium]MDE7338228.1 NifU family protein [Bacteroidales bacterium]